MPFDVTLLVLGAAFMHASWNAIAKSSADKLLEITVMGIAGAGVCALALPFVPPPHPEAWTCLAISVLLHTLYFAALAAAYHWGDLSHAYPLMRGGAPVLVALVGVPVLAEGLTTAMWSGILLISSGILLPFWLLRRHRAGHARATLFALANAVIIASYTLVDGIGTRLSEQPVSYCLWLFLLNPLPILAFAVVRHRSGVWRYMKQRWVPCGVGGLLTVCAYGIVLWAMTRAPIAAVAALRETSVIFAALIAAVFLREGFGPVRVVGAACVVCGIALLRL